MICAEGMGSVVPPGPGLDGRIGRRSEVMVTGKHLVLSMSLNPVLRQCPDGTLGSSSLARFGGWPVSHRTLLVATPGGHIEELVELTNRIEDVGSDRVWVTAYTPQTSRLLATENVHWVAPVGSRQLWRASASLPASFALLRRVRPRLVISTGAALAVPYLVAARTFGAETHYIESATRLAGPSLTGRLMTRLPGVRLHHQGFRVPVPRWYELGSVFEGYQPGPDTDTSIRRVVITLGTERFPFPRALVQVARALRGDVEVLIQTGHTPPLATAFDSRPWVPADELLSAIKRADVVVMHAGVGSILAALRAGKHPVILPRYSSLGEHIDDHQRELAARVADQGLATVMGPDEDLTQILPAAARRTSVRAPQSSIKLSQT